MTDKFQNKYRIPSNRWQFWNYSAPGSYFITICIQDREEILGRIVNGIMQLSEWGKIAASEFINIPQYHKRVNLDRWVIMPNHVHCIITLGSWDYDNGVSAIGDDVIVSETSKTECTPVDKIREFYLPGYITPTPSSTDDIKQYRALRRKMLIPKIIGKFKMITSKQMNILRNTPERKNWQHDYYDHVIRDPQRYMRIEQYIINNPLKWNNDRFKGNESNMEH